MSFITEGFTKHYVPVKRPAKNKSGFQIEYVYYAPWYAWLLPPNKLLVRKYTLLVACILDSGIFLLAAMEHTAVNYTLMVAVPGMLSLAALMFEVIGVVQFFISKERMTKPQYDGIRLKLRTFPLFRAILMTATVAAAVYQLVTGGIDTGSMLVTVGYAICAILAGFIYLSFRTIPFSTARNRVLDELKKNPDLGEVVKPPAASEAGEAAEEAKN